MTTQVKEFFKITALTNLHVGSGDQNYGIVDKLVQRDPLTQFPIIHASSLKGALKNYCESYQTVLPNSQSESTENEEKTIEELHHSFLRNDIRNSFGDDDGFQGQDKYFSAHLFTIPVRSNCKPYYRATCPAILKEMVEFFLAFGFNLNSKLIEGLKELGQLKFNSDTKFIVFEDPCDNCLIEEYELKENFEIKKESFADGLIEILKYDPLSINKKDFILVRDDVFMEICANLPVVARNRVDKKTNLWYEELVPRQAEFYFFYFGSEINSHAILEKIVINSNKGMPVQIGANASVGYGYCKINKISKS
ncbi:MAG: type III-B CRISPR module RAMP protein Cmr4 [Mariniphaga sp.]